MRPHLLLGPHRAAKDVTMATPIEQLVSIMAQLRDPERGCPWDLDQSFATIAPYTIEEAYELADAIARNDAAAICDELGDVLLQVVFHAQMAKELGLFDFDDVAKAISAKMIRRHPHVFGTAQADAADAVTANWERIKADERGADASALDGVALALPALLRAEKLQKRAARTGFDWPDATGALEKIAEETEELAHAQDAASRFDEFGDLLFAMVNVGRHLGLNPEEALRHANAKFETRFRAMEQAAGPAFCDLPLDRKEALWQAAKRTVSLAKAPQDDQTTI